MSASVQGSQRPTGAGTGPGAGGTSAGMATGPGPDAAGAAPPTLATDRLSVTYRTEEGESPAVRDATIAVHAGEAVGLVGESGSGKTTFALGAIGYLPENGRVTDGASRLHGVDLLTLPKKELRALWGARIGLVSQDPQGAFNPTLTIGRQLDEMAGRHLDLGRAGAHEASLAMLERVDMPDPRTALERYPHQLSGGMLQRCAIAMALLTHPDLLILDEPTTALDVTTQALILDLLAGLQDEFQLAILYITHNLGVVSRFCDRVVVMYAGEVFEEGPVADLYSDPLHPYTANLLHCVPRLHRLGILPGGRLATLPGDLPPLGDLPRGCIFAPRCPLAIDSCRAARPPLVEAVPGRLTACLRWPVMTTDEGRRQAVRTETEAAAPAEDGVSAGDAAATPAPTAPATAAAAQAGALQAAAQAGVPLLTVEDAVKDFPGPHRHTLVRAVDGVSLSLPAGRTYGLVGESGSGKTTLARVVAGLTPPTSGTVSLEHETLRPTVDKRSRDMLRRLQMVFQSPESSLNPRHTVRQELVRPLVRLADLDRGAAERRAQELLRAVRLPLAYLDRYPGELSGGEKQRVAIARAFAAGPDLVICDEPVSSLDVSVQGALMNLLLDLQEGEGTSYLFISHDLAAVQHLSHFIGVMYLGKLVEQGEAEQVLSPPYHPYTEALLAAVPDPDEAVERARGTQAALLPPRTPAGAEAAGCPFEPRCPRSLGEVCRVQEPSWQSVGPGGAVHAIRCHIPYEELGGQREAPPAGDAGAAPQEPAP
jgi:peptide/nickel transport system ATP-binding protein